MYSSRFCCFEHLFCLFSSARGSSTVYFRASRECQGLFLIKADANSTEQEQTSRLEVPEVHEQSSHLMIELDSERSPERRQSRKRTANSSLRGSPTAENSSIPTNDATAPQVASAANQGTAGRNNRILALGAVTGITDNLVPVVGYAAEPILPLAEACAPLANILHNLSFYVQMALDETPPKPFDDLTVDESAAIRLYTIEWEAPHRSLYSMLNYTLKTAPRVELQPYHKYMKLFLTALVKLPCVPPVTVWRGVTKNLSDEFPRGTLVTWWAFSSCTTELTVLESNMYLGTTGERTLFSVEVFNGRTVRAHSHFVTEDEILVLPGTLMEVQSIFSPAADLSIVHLRQIKPAETLLELPFEGQSRRLHHSSI
jgi:hypothetical protein